MICEPKDDTHQKSVNGKSTQKHLDSGHIDQFVIKNLPVQEEQPDFLFDGIGCELPERLNIAERLVDRWVLEGKGDRPAILNEHGEWTYRRLQHTANQIAQVLVEEFGLVSGNRVLLHGLNNPMLVACWLAIVKAGGVVVAVAPLLRARDIAPVVEKGRISVALCDSRLIGEAKEVEAGSSHLSNVIGFNGVEGCLERGEFENLYQAKSGIFNNADLSINDPLLLAFTSGTTGDPKATVHYHRDVVLMSASYVDHVIKPSHSDVFIGSPPLAFTFGLGGLLTFPFHIGASVVLLENGAADKLVAAIERHKATICFTAPTAYRAVLALEGQSSLASLRYCISAGEHLPLAVFDDWDERYGVKILNLLGATEMFHSFICMRPDNIKAGAVGMPAPGFEACILDGKYSPVATGDVGHLAVRGPTGCRYLNDERQQKYVINGWNVTGDLFYKDDDGFYWFVSRSDDMIVSSGYNISGVEVESVLIEHDAVKEVAVEGAPDSDRGQLVTAYIVLNHNFEASDVLIHELQADVKEKIAPFKYPRAINFVSELPKTATGKIQRGRLRELQTISN